MANSPYTTKTISNYNNSPPADDGTTVSSNQLSWDKHKTKLGDPIKTLAESINTELVSAFAKVINTDADENNVMGGSLAFTKNEKTISTGSITPTRSFHSVDTESDAATDTLDTIATGSVSDGCRMLLLGENVARVVTIAHTDATSTATTNITLIGQANKTLSDVHPVELVLNGGKWYENASEVDLATVAPSNLAATATSGTGLLAARSDHVHKFPTATELGLEIGVDVLSPTGDGSGLTGISTVDQTARDNTVINAWDIAVQNGLAVGSLINTVYDTFTDETGVDTGASTNETYDSTNDLYTNLTSATTGTYAIAAGTIGNFGDGATGAKNIAIQFTPASTTKVTDVSVEVMTVTAAMSDATAQVYTDNSGSPGSGVGSASGSLNITTTGKKTFTFATSVDVTGSTLYWIVFTDNTSTGILETSQCANQAGYISGKSDTATSITDGLGIGSTNDWRVEINTALVSDMSLNSNSFTAASAPATLRGLFEVEEVDAYTINTDVIGKVSRDGGTTWATLTLAEVSSITATRKIYAATGDVSAQPSAANVEIQFVTANTKQIKLHQWAVQADVNLSV